MSKVICEKALRCPEPDCGGKEPHWPNANECNHCPKDRLARCVPIEIFDYEENKNETSIYNH